MVQVLWQTEHSWAEELMNVLEGQLETQEFVEASKNKEPLQDKQFVLKGPSHVEHEASQLRHWAGE